MKTTLRPTSIDSLYRYLIYFLEDELDEFEDLYVGNCPRTTEDQRHEMRLAFIDENHLDGLETACTLFWAIKDGKDLRKYREVIRKFYLERTEQMQEWIFDTCSEKPIEDVESDLESLRYFNNMMIAVEIALSGECDCH